MRMVCCICLASNPALVAYESVLSGSVSDYILLSPVLLCVCVFFFFFRSLLFSLLLLYTMLLPGYFQIPRGLPTWLEKSNERITIFHMISYAITLIFCWFLCFFFSFFFLSRCKTDMVGLGWVGLETEPQKVAGKAS